MRFYDLLRRLVVNFEMTRIRRVQILRLRQPEAVSVVEPHDLFKEHAEAEGGAVTVSTWRRPRPLLPRWSSGSRRRDLVAVLVRLILPHTSLKKETCLPDVDLNHVRQVKRVSSTTTTFTGRLFLSFGWCERATRSGAGEFQPWMWSPFSRTKPI